MNENPNMSDKTGIEHGAAENLQGFIELSPLPVYVVGNDFELLLVNSAACEYLNAASSDLIGARLGDIVRPEELQRLMRLTDRQPEEKTPRGEWELQRRDGSWVWAELTLRVLPSGSWLIFASDINDRIQREKAFAESEEQRFQMQKFDALGRLAGGIAHDFNNFLAVIMLQIDMLNLQLAADSPLRNRVTEIKEVSKNAAAIVKQLLAFGRKLPMSPAPLVLNQALKDLSKILKSLVGDNIKMEFALDPALGVCFVDQNQIGQVLMNLTVNAKDAMPDGGLIRIETANIVIEKAQVQGSQAPGAYIQVTYTDNGAGMHSATEDRIFEPFFSTRETDKGAGLGLASVYGTIKQLKGYIWVESEVGLGTTFRIQFPRIDQPLAADPDPEPYSMPRGSETILLVEDDENVRRLSASVLRMSGYEVLEAGSGIEALEIAGSRPGTIHLLVTDFFMPNMDGREVARQMRGLHPETSILFISGDTIETISGEAENGEVPHFLEKPFTPSKLTVKVREILDA